ncbi:hypothetical protein C7974DRAFT_378929 [Boeremia exigua]|uniref:uncharacterized protein n=1 Tax=Boeremia exigua TaxID=749465 RepID=UPI001E8DD6D5|nr:uncharacterized protein C7974DRAFT_378929 [Boeremia exigua]KAH6618763.1 hypothetical protein C7974DRAFT_378929 [Boeremia exigua]
MGAPLAFALRLLWFAACANSLPINNPSNNLAVRAEAKSDKEGLSDEAIIGIAAISVSVLLSVLALVLSALRKRILGCCTAGKHRTLLNRRRRRHILRLRQSCEHLLCEYEYKTRPTSTGTKEPYIVHRDGGAGGGISYGQPSSWKDKPLPPLPPEGVKESNLKALPPLPFEKDARSSAKPTLSKFREMDCDVMTETVESGSQFSGETKKDENYFSSLIVKMCSYYLFAYAHVGTTTQSAPTQLNLLRKNTMSSSTTSLLQPVAAERPRTVSFGNTPTPERPLNSRKSTMTTATTSSKTSESHCPQCDDSTSKPLNKMKSMSDLDKENEARIAKSHKGKVTKGVVGMMKKIKGAWAKKA